MSSLSNNGHDQEPVYVLALGGTFLALCTIIVGLRFYTRILQKVYIGIDDWLVLCALVMVIGCALVLIIGVRLRALGFPTPPPRNKQDPGDEKSYIFTTVEQLEWSFFLMQILSMGFTKLSFVFFFRRIFLTGKPKSIFRFISTVVIITVIVWVTTFFFWFLLSCGTHFSSRWTTMHTLHRMCPSDDRSDFALAISDFITDVFILTLPIPMVWQLHMNTNRKVAVLAVFGLGFVALIASIIRLALFVNIIALATGKIKDPDADNDLLTTRSLYWSMLESGLALIACCLPTLNFLARLPVSQSVIKSFRSVADTRTSRIMSERFSEVHDMHGLNSTASEIEFIPKQMDKADIETQAVGGVYTTPNAFRTTGKGDIWVAHTVDQSDKMR